ncbi:MAG TPA: HIT family protein [Ignavibacteriaceae bacterium]|nr:HIT family protein [Ignavibacteriaceae bacterium]
MDCIFCDIVSGKEKAEIIYQDENVISFLDIRPINYGHALVIPKTHYENFHAVSPEDLNSVISVTQKVADAVNKGLSTDGINIIANNGVASGQTIFHFHFHIIPRFKTDAFNYRPVLKSYGSGQMKEFADKIRIAVKK